MGILGIENRTENWKTAYHFSSFFRDASARSDLANQLLKPLCESQSGEVHLELFWFGMRDYIHEGKLDEEETAQDFAERYNRLFCSLRGDIDKFNGLSLPKDSNYAVPVGNGVKKLYDNLRHTEIDIVLETPNHLFIGEAKDASRLDAKGSYFLVHQLIRQYVMATILVDLRKPEKKVIPFVVGDSDKLASLMNTVQVKFMLDQGWLKEGNVLSWDDIKELHP